MTNKMSAIKIANPYAEAFFQLGISLYLKTDNPDDFYPFIFDIQELLILLVETPELESFLCNPLNSANSKKVFLKKVFKDKFNINTINFLNLLIDKKRIKFIRIIGKIFLDKSYEYLCLTFVEVWSTIKLTKKQEEDLTNRVTEMLRPMLPDPHHQTANIELVLRVDKKILGGIIIKIGSKIIDLSLRGELQRLGKDLNIII